MLVFLHIQFKITSEYSKMPDTNSYLSLAPNVSTTSTVAPEEKPAVSLVSIPAISDSASADDKIIQ
jgi:hypothetical protein